MSENIVSMRGGPVPESRTPSPVFIEWLEDLLEQAKAGEALGFAGSVMHSDRSVSYSVVGVVEGFSMVGGLEMAKFSLIEADQQARE